MIDAKQFMEFFEDQCGVKFVDAQTGKRVLDEISKKDRRKRSLLNDQAYKSDYDKYLEESGDAL